mgnify:CR=1 FL=1
MVTPRRISWLLAPVLTVVAGCGTDTQEPAQPPQTNTKTTERAVIYGEDNRLDVYAHPDEQWRELTRRSIVAMVPRNLLDQSDPENVQIISDETLGQARNLCEDQRFRNDPDVSNCSATLIDDDLVLTAGHCIENQNVCNNRYFVFNVHFAAEGQLAPITTNEVYTCQRLVQSIPGGDLDHAIIQLDRPVTGNHGPAPVRMLDQPLDTDQEVTLIGYPNGIPAKIANGGRVIDNRAGTLDFFEATVDAFGGNSGSGVFDEDGNVVGILVRGEQDYTTRGECTVVNVLSDDRSVEEGAEDVTYVARAIEDLCTQGWPSERLCGGNQRGWCFTCEQDEDCQDGWTCRQWDDAPEVSFCAAPCEADEDCREDHTCNVELGSCEPRRSGVCRDQQPWTIDACGRELVQNGTCGEDEFCNAGQCVERGVGDICETAEAIDPVDQSLTGDLSVGYSNTRRGDCGGNGPERIYTFTLEEETSLLATATGFDTVLHLRRACNEGNSQILCVDDSEPPGDRGSQLQIDLEPGDYTLMMDSFRAETAGVFTLELEFGPVCEEICELGVPVCEDEATVRTCVADEGGCPVLGDLIECGEGEVCQNGNCFVPGEGDQCEGAVEIEAVSQVLSGDTRQGYRNNHQGSCAGEGPEQVFTFTLDSRTRFQAQSFGYDTVLYLRRGCEDDAEVACNDDISRQERNSALIGVLDAGTYFLFMDAFGDVDDAFELALRFDPLCDNECDAGQTVCTDQGLLTCVPDIDGCTQWRGPEPCPNGQVCRAGQCEQACEDECDSPGSRTCVSDIEYRLCGIGPEGCLVLGQPRVCPDGGACTGDGACIVEEDPDDEPEDEDPDDEPEIQATSSAKDDGCTTTPANLPSSPAPWLLIGALGAFLWARRRTNL